MDPHLTPRIHEFIGWEELRCPREFQRLRTGAGLKLRSSRAATLALTGSQCAGKTTVIKALGARGAETIPEYIREKLEAGPSHGFEMAEIKRALPQLVITAASRHVNRLVGALEGDDDIVCDRGFGDIIGKLRLIRLATVVPGFVKKLLRELSGDRDYSAFLDSKENRRNFSRGLHQQIGFLKGWAAAIRYDNVLWLESMPELVKDGIRVEKSFMRKILALYIKHGWRSIGYNPIRVPAYYGDVEGRVEHIASLIEDSKRK